MKSQNGYASTSDTSHPVTVAAEADATTRLADDPGFLPQSFSTPAPTAAAFYYDNYTNAAQRIYILLFVTGRFIMLVQ